MPSKKVHVPKYCLHKRSGHARVKFDGREIFLGKYGTAESRRQYARLIAELGSAPAVASLPADPQDAWQQITLVELMAASLAHARDYYPAQSCETARIIEALRILKELYGDSLVAEFTPKRLKAVRQAMIDKGLGRKLINGRVQKITRMFKWGVSEDLLPASIHSALSKVEGLRRGYCDAKESQPVRPVTDHDVQATLPYLSPIVADMVRLQRLTGARPTELRLLSPGVIVRAGDVWIYRPPTHKTAYLGKSRAICTGTAHQPPGRYTPPHSYSKEIAQSFVVDWDFYGSAVAMR